MTSAEGTIVKGVGGNYYISAGDRIIECSARGRLRRELAPTVGDRVSINIGRDGTGSIEKILPRRNCLIRPSVANIDILLVVCAAASPEPDLGLLDKLLAIAACKDIEGVVCVNKTDLVSDAGSITDVYRRAGYRTLTACAKTGEGLDEICGLIKGKTVAFAGLSGVGKSSLLSLVTGRSLEVGDVSRIERGRHTTRHVELISAHGGYVLDTPGFSRLEVEGIKAQELRLLFPEMKKMEGQCRFRGCTHTAEPDCAVISAVEKGEIAASRYDSYKEMYGVLKGIKEWEEKK